MFGPDLYSHFLFNEEATGNSGGSVEGVDQGQGSQQGDSGSQEKGDIPSHIRHFTHDQTRRAVRDALREVPTRDDFNSLRELVEKIATPGSSNSNQQQAESSNDSGRGSKGSEKGEGEKLETPIDTKFNKLQARLEALENEKNSLVESLSKKEMEMKEKELEARIADVASKNNAISPAQVYRLIRENVIQDEEQGAVFEVQGQYGKEYKTPEEYIPEWLSQNKHFVKPVNKSGSGTSAGSEEGGVFNFTQEQLRDPDFYVANRDKIRKEYEKRVRG